MRLLKTLFLLVIFSGMAAAAVGYWFYQRLTTEPLRLRSEKVQFTIPAGARLTTAADLIEDAGVGLPAWQLALYGRALGQAGQIKAGSYEVSGRLTAAELLDMLIRGDVIMARLTLVEGKTWREFRAALNEHPDLTHDTRALTDIQLLAQLGIKANSLEGQFLPDTYLFDKGSSDLEVLRRANVALQGKLTQAWEGRDTNLRLGSASELLVLASVVEKETGMAADRPKIAAVFANRLRVGMPLQSDPTVIYGLGAKFDGNLRRVDLLTDTPWNTYTRGGLPPTPICMPGARSLEVASRPAQSEAYYFVARGDGSSEFSATLDAHNRAVTLYQKSGR